MDVGAGAPAAGATLPPLALYVHFPWCVSKCPYCDFNSHALHGELPVAAYLAALLADLDQQLPAALGRPIASIFMGGGTPSLFPPEAVGKLLEGVRARLTVAAGAEVTMEANPGTLECGRFADYRAAGVTRVSLGVQSFDAVMLRRLGRIHDAQQARDAAAELHAAGLSNFNIDLMYALPGQAEGGAVADLRAAMALGPAHLSHYQMALEPGTVFGGRPPEGMPDDDAAFAMQLDCQRLLADGGYAQYEVSAYARAGAQCAHNLNYWRFGDYIGIGAGAHGKLSAPAEGRLGFAIARTRREREPRRYLAAGHVAPPAPEPVEERARPFEFMMNALRLAAGFSQQLYESRTGLAWSSAEPRVRKLAQRGLMEEASGQWRATAQGRRFLNDLMADFLEEG